MLFKIEIYVHTCEGISYFFLCCADVHTVHIYMGKLKSIWESFQRRSELLRNVLGSRPDLWKKVCIDPSKSGSRTYEHTVWWPKVNMQATPTMRPLPTGTKSSHGSHQTGSKFHPRKSGSFPAPQKYMESNFRTARSAPQTTSWQPSASHP